MTLNTALRPSLKMGIEVPASQADCEGSVSPAGSWIIVTARQILVESLSDCLFPGSSFRKFVQGRGFYVMQRGRFQCWSLASFICRHQCLKRVYLGPDTFVVTLLMLWNELQTRLNSVFSPDSAPYQQAITLPHSTFLVLAVGNNPSIDGGE